MKNNAQLLMPREKMLKFGISALTDVELLALFLIKRRDQENEEIALTVGKLRVELEAAEKRIAELEAEHHRVGETMHPFIDIRIFHHQRRRKTHSPLLRQSHAACRS